MELTSDVENLRTLYVEADCLGYNNTVGAEIATITGDLGPGESVACVYAHADLTAATSADATTTVPCFIAGTTNSSNATSKAYLALAGFDKAFQVYGSAAENLSDGYKVHTGGTVVADNTAAFNSSGTDVEVFTDENDWILIGSDNTFEILQVLLKTASSKNCNLEFYYTQGGGTWAALSVADTTTGFQNSGDIVFSAPGDWVKDDQMLVDTDITNAYYIGIKRTYASPIRRLPVEDYFRTYANRSTGMEIRGDGAVVLPYVSAIPASPVNGMIWMESDGLHIYYNGAERTVAGA